MLQSLFYFPSSIVAVDDNQEILQTLADLFDKTYQIKTFEAANAAMSYLKDYQSPLSSIELLQASTDYDNLDESEHYQTSLKIINIAKLAEYAERSKEISVLIVDFDMAEINGLDFCRELKNIPIKKILLTGIASYKDAVSAFNDHVINAFIRKDSPTVIEELEQTVKNMVHQYFYDRSQTLLANLTTTTTFPFSDESFFVFFYDWCQKNQITEYYLIDKNGSFQCINTEGKKLYFIVQNRSCAQ